MNLRKIALQAAIALGSLTTIPQAHAAMTAAKPWIIITSKGEPVGTSGDLFTAVIDLSGYATKEACLIAKGRYEEAFEEGHMPGVTVACAYVPGLPK